MNVHAPERQEGETQSDYRLRRKVSAGIAKRAAQPHAQRSAYHVQRIAPIARTARRVAIRHAGGIRQYKRMRCAASQA